MQRGILNITKNEAEFSIQLLKNSIQDVYSFLQRLDLVLNGTEEESRVEVSRFEVEVLLDSLPMPSENEEEVYKKLRNKITYFLNKNK